MLSTLAHGEVFRTAVLARRTRPRLGARRAVRIARAASLRERGYGLPKGCVDA